jgi:hypothetical protein
MTHRDTVRRILPAVACGIVLLLSACHKITPTEDAKPTEAKESKATDAEPDDAKASAGGVTLPRDQVDKLGILTESAQAADYTAETAGYGVVLPHESIAAAVAELTTAELTEKQTHAALARAQSLNGTPGALSAEVEETASRQSAADTAAHALATQRLSSIIGLNPAWKATDGKPMLQNLASGKIKLLRATFPLGTVRGPAPASLRAAHLDAIQNASPEAALGSKLTSVWDAPADASVPGRSFFALLKGSDFNEGERVLVWAPGAGHAQSGVLIPAAAVVISNGKYWCYVEKQPGTYLRVEVNTDRPMAGGYVVTNGVNAGDKVVRSAAGLLLARETNSDTDAD